MEGSGVIYFDNAATSFPKPARVYNEVRDCMLYSGGNAGRGAHALSMAAARKIFDCRVATSELFGSKEPENVVFTLNTTYALNLVIKGILKSGDHVLISDLEHNAVYRPICALARKRGVKYDIFNTYTLEGACDEAVCADILRLIKPETRMLVCTCVSNVCSRALPVESIGRICREKGIIFVLDAAQGAGHVDIDVRKMNIDILCAPSHKGLCGPQGCGIIIFGDGVACDTLIEGGNGYESMSDGMGDVLPERFEAGTLPAPVISGLCEGIKSVMEIGVPEIAAHERTICSRALDMLMNIDGVTVYAPRYLGSTLLFNLDGIGAERLSAELDRHGICVRGGYHCAALAHRTLGTAEGGAVRLSFGRYNKLSELDALWKVLKSIAYLK